VPAVARPLAIVLVTLGGVLAGYFFYRLAHRSAVRPESAATAAAAAASTAPTGAPGAPGAADAGDGAAGAARPIPDRVPDLALPDLAGQPRSLRAYGGHPLIINFWATWCAPCRREMPLLQRLRRTYRADGLQIVGIAVDFRAAVVEYLRRQPVDYPQLVGEDAGLAAAEQFGMQTVLPFSVFADARGRIVAVKIGELHADEAAYILGTMRELAAGRVSLADAHAGITQRLRELAIERARAGDRHP
jgi:thiol-disulfide isomerase/thioredoxin